MIKVSNDYKGAMTEKIRQRAFISVSLGVVNQMAQANSEVVNNGLAPWTSNDVFGGEPSTLNPYATLEDNFFPLDGSARFMPEVTQYNSDGVCTENTLGAVTISFGDSYDIKGFTIDFGVAYPTSLRISNGTTTHDYTLTSRNFVTEDVFNGTTTLTITPLEMVGGQQRMLILSILMGVGFVFTNAQVNDFSLSQSMSSISSELPLQDISVRVFDNDGKFDVDNDESFMNYLEPMQPMEVSLGMTIDDGSVEWLKVSSARIKSWSSNKNVITFNACDKLSQTENSFSHETLTRRTVYDEIALILTSAGYSPEEYSIDSYLSTVFLSAPISEMAYKEAIQLLCNYSRCIFMEKQDGTLAIKGGFATVLEPEDLTLSTNGVTDWSEPTNILTETSTHYVDFTTNMFPTNNGTKFLPEDGAYLDSTGYVSSQVSKADGTFDENPYIKIMFPASYSYYGIGINFWGSVPKELVIKTYNDGVLIDSFEHTDDISANSLFWDEYTSFNELRIYVTKTEPFSRVAIDQISFGNASDFILSKDLMTSNIIGTKEEKVRNVMVKVYSYTTGDDGKIEVVDDNVWVSYQVNTTGVDRKCENPLVTTQAQAVVLAEWLANYYANDVSYSVDYRGDPRLQAGDVIKLESAYHSNLQVEISSLKLKFSGAFSGSLELRRATNAV